MYFPTLTVEALPDVSGTRADSLGLYKADTVGTLARLFNDKYLYFFTYRYETRAFPSKMASQKCRQNLIF